MAYVIGNDCIVHVSTNVQ